MKRFFVNAPPELQKRVRVLAAIFDSSAEKYGGVLLDRIVTQVENELGMHSKQLPPKAKK